MRGAGTALARHCGVMQITGPERSHRALCVVGGVVLVGLLATTSTARAAWDEIAMFLTLQGKPEPASANVLSEHESETLDAMPPQSQAELLLERSINHYAGANDQIAAREVARKAHASRLNLRHRHQLRRLRVRRPASK